MVVIVRAVRTLDCANKVRIHYLLAQPITRRFLARFRDATVDVQDFSKRVAGAKDHFAVNLGNRVRASGVLGEAKMVVTYGKDSAQAADDDIREFERRLAADDSARGSAQPAVDHGSQADPL